MGKIIPAIIVDNPTYPERNRVNSQNKKQMNNKTITYYLL